MTRSAGEALDEQQLSLGAKCEELLASDKWNRADAAKQSGVIQRLELIEAAGLPPMRVVRAKTLEQLGRVPRSHEGFQLNALSEVRRCGKDQHGKPKAVIFFYSHRWKRPNWCEATQTEAPWGSPERETARSQGHAVGDPDDAEHSKAQALVEYEHWFREEGRGKMLLTGTTACADMELFFWIDWACTDQEAAGPDMAALPAFVGACGAILASWSPEYARRGWCQVELLMAFAFMAEGAQVLVLPERFKKRAGLHVAKSKAVVADPVRGELSNPDDRGIIRGLSEVAVRSRSFSCWRNAYNLSFGTDVCRCIALNLLGCCQCCCLIPFSNARSVRPGTSHVVLLTPAARS